jgi:hypothetical protein
MNRIPPTTTIALPTREYDGQDCSPTFQIIGNPDRRFVSLEFGSNVRIYCPGYGTEMVEFLEKLKASCEDTLAKLANLAEKGL